jgi:hypothetical protein
VEKDDDVTEAPNGGCRHIDRVLAADYVRDLGDAALRLLRDKRDQAAQEETKLSYLRRLLHARIDILKAEQYRRSSGAEEPLVEQLATILSQNAVGAPSRSDRHQELTPLRPDDCSNQVEKLIENSDLSDVGSLSDQDLTEVLRSYTQEEERVSIQRRKVQQVVDVINAEIMSRYAKGTASVDELLARERTPEA